MKPVQPIQMNIYQSNTYRKDLNWLYFNDEPRVQERQQVKDQQSFISAFVAYLPLEAKNELYSTCVHSVMLHGRYTWPVKEDV